MSRIVKQIEVRKHRGDDPTTFAWTFDFEGVSPDVVADIATRDLVIRLQQKHRDGKPVPRSGSVIRVADMIAGRSIVDPVSAAEAAIAAMSPEQRAEMLKKLQAK